MYQMLFSINIEIDNTDINFVQHVSWLNLLHFNKSLSIKRIIHLKMVANFPDFLCLKLKEISFDSIHKSAFFDGFCMLFCISDHFSFHRKRTMAPNVIIWVTWQVYACWLWIPLEFCLKGHHVFVFLPKS